MKKHNILYKQKSLKKSKKRIDKPDDCDYNDKCAVGREQNMKI